MPTKALKRRASHGAAGRPRRAAPKILALIREHRKQSAIAGKCWDKAEQALEELIRTLRPSKIVAVDDGVFAKVVDLFADANQVFVPKVMRRHKLVICDADGKEIRLRDRRRRSKETSTGRKRV